MTPSEASPILPAQTHRYEKLRAPPSGMRYVLVSDQQPSSVLRQQVSQAQQQPIGIPQCYVCSAVAVQRCFFGMNTANHCRKIMCLIHAESTMYGLGTYYYCQEHFAVYLDLQNLESEDCCCSIL
jgi:hypothetical protein